MFQVKHFEPHTCTVIQWFGALERNLLLLLLLLTQSLQPQRKSPPTHPSDPHDPPLRPPPPPPPPPPRPPSHQLRQDPCQARRWSHQQTSRTPDHRDVVQLARLDVVLMQCNHSLIIAPTPQACPPASAVRSAQRHTLASFVFLSIEMSIEYCLQDVLLYA